MSSFTPALFIAFWDKSNGMSDSITFIITVTFFQQMSQGDDIHLLTLDVYHHQI